jgi:adenosyl cobinamide kinase/adenosyl cobinamide phosphate guanylyltransferase
VIPLELWHPQQQNRISWHQRQQLPVWNFTNHVTTTEYLQQQQHNIKMVDDYHTIMKRMTTDFFTHKLKHIQQLARAANTLRINSTSTTTLELLLNMLSRLEGAMAAPNNSNAAAIIPSTVLGDLLIT